MSGCKYSRRYIMGHTLKHNIEETGRIINSIDINQFNTDRRNYIIGFLFTNYVKQSIEEFSKRFEV